jgi:hypothetical protein
VNIAKLPSGKYICNLQAMDISGNPEIILAQTQFIFEVTP